MTAPCSLCRPWGGQVLQVRLIDQLYTSGDCTLIEIGPVGPKFAVGLAGNFIHHVDDDGDASAKMAQHRLPQRVQFFSGYFSAGNRLQFDDDAVSGLLSNLIEAEDGHDGAEWSCKVLGMKF